MIPAHQTIFGDRRGNCFAACIASVLEIPIYNVPNFCLAEDWLVQAIRFAKSHGYGLLHVQDGKGVRLLAAETSCYSLVTGKSPRGDFLHSVVYRGLEMAHDPHPSGDGLGGDPEDWIFFIAINPAIKWGCP